MTTALDAASPEHAVHEECRWWSPAGAHGTSSRPGSAAIGPTPRFVLAGVGACGSPLGVPRRYSILPGWSASGPARRSCMPSMMFSRDRPGTAATSGYTMPSSLAT